MPERFSRCCATGCSVDWLWKAEQRSTRTVAPRLAASSTSASVSVVLPSPGSPSSSCGDEPPVSACCQAARSDCSRPVGSTSGGRRVPAGVAVAASTRARWIGRAGSFSTTGPSGSTKKRGGNRSSVAWLTSTVPGCAIDWMCAATFGASPSASAPVPLAAPSSPTTTRPEWMPTRAASPSGTRCARACPSRRTAAVIASPARTARSASSSWASGKPKYTSTPSPRYCATWPPAGRSTSTQASW